MMKRMLSLRNEWVQSAKGSSRQEQEMDRKLRLPSQRVRLIKEALQRGTIDVETDLMLDSLEGETVGLVNRLRDRAKTLGQIPAGQQKRTNMPTRGQVQPGIQTPNIGPEVKWP